MKRLVASRIRLIKRHRSYSSSELANLLGVHPRTIQLWLKEGLEPINPDSGRFLFKGEVAKVFLNARSRTHKCSLRPDEFYCQRCKMPRISTANQLGLAPYRREISASRVFVVLTGTCHVCGCKLRRFAVLRYDQFARIGMMYEGRQVGLESIVGAHLNCTR